MYTSRQRPLSWSLPPTPTFTSLEGRLVRVEKLDEYSPHHYQGLFALHTLPDAEKRMAFLFSSPPKSKEDFDEWMQWVAHNPEGYLCYVVIDKASGEVAGRQSFYHVNQPDGSIEIGGMLRGPALARRPGSTEAFYLVARHLFEELGYRRFVWSCDFLNEESKRAAQRLGFTFEGVARHGLVNVQKGVVADKAIYSILDSEWKLLSKVFENWLDPANFDSQGEQKQRLKAISHKLGCGAKRLTEVPIYEPISLHIHPTQYSIPTSEPRQWPSATRFEGRYVLLERLDPTKHFEDLYAASTIPDAEQRLRYMWESVPESREEFMEWMREVESSRDPIYFAVVDKASGRVGGRQTLMRIDQLHGVVEIGHIYWGPLVSRKPAATEALFLFAKYVFDELGYSRLEWRHHADNQPSRNAAKRFGFVYEGVHRQYGFLKRVNKDLAFHAIINVSCSNIRDGSGYSEGEWPLVKEALERWLSGENFDAEGKQRMRLVEIREQVKAEKSK